MLYASVSMHKLRNDIKKCRESIFFNLQVIYSDSSFKNVKNSKLI